MPIGIPILVILVMIGVIIFVANKLNWDTMEKIQFIGYVGIIIFIIISVVLIGGYSFFDNEKAKELLNKLILIIS